MPYVEILFKRENCYIQGFFNTILEIQFKRQNSRIQEFSYPYFGKQILELPASKHIHETKIHMYTLYMCIFVSCIKGITRIYIDHPAFRA